MSTENKEGWTEIEVDASISTEVPNPAPEANKDPEIELPETPQDEDLSSRAQKRIVTLSRKLKDTATQYDLRLAQAAQEKEVLQAELEALKVSTQQQAKGTAATLKKAAEDKLAMAKQSLKTAYNEADPDKIAEAIEAQTKATFEIQAINSWESRVPPPAPKKEVAPVQRQETLPEAATEWLTKNPWYSKGPRQDRIAAVMATEIGDSLVNEGWDLTDPSYYEELDRRLVEELPRVAKLKTRDPVVTRSPVAGTSRSAAPTPAGRSPIRIQLSPEDLDMAKRLGIDPKAYAKEKAKLGNAGQGYTTIGAGETQ